MFFNGQHQENVLEPTAKFVQKTHQQTDKLSFFAHFWSAYDWNTPCLLKGRIKKSNFTGWWNLRSRFRVHLSQYNVIYVFIEPRVLHHLQWLSYNGWNLSQKFFKIYNGCSLAGGEDYDYRLVPFLGWSSSAPPGGTEHLLYNTFWIRNLKFREIFERMGGNFCFLFL